MELMGVLTAVRLIRFVKRHIDTEISATVIYSDSQCVLGWIKKPDKQDLFVSNRLSEILRDDNTTFNYVRTHENPADYLTREHSVSDLNQLWWKGPEWLMLPHTYQEPINIPPAESIPQAESMGIATQQPAVVATAERTDEPPLFDYKRYSSLTRLIRTAATLIIAAEKFRQSRQTPHTINSEYIRKGRLLLEKLIQEEAFSTEKTLLHSGKQNDRIRTLQLFTDGDDILRCGGRLERAELPSETIHPKLLPTKHKFTDLVIQEAHERSSHSGTSQTLAEVRKTYWIPKGRSAVKRVVKSCKTCRKYEGPAYSVPNMPPLPTQRVTASCPFTNIGVDYFGPFVSRDNKVENKFQICIFTCSAVRAVHLEKVADMSAESFIRAVRRFVARRGLPSSIISDNGRNFISANQTLRKLMDEGGNKKSGHNVLFLHLAD